MRQPVCCATQCAGAPGKRMRVPRATQEPAYALLPLMLLQLLQLLPLQHRVQLAAMHLCSCTGTHPPEGHSTHATGPGAAAHPTVQGCSKASPCHAVWPPAKGHIHAHRARARCAAPMCAPAQASTPPTTLHCPEQHTYAQKRTTETCAVTRARTYERCAPHMCLPASRCAPGTRTSGSRGPCCPQSALCRA